MSSILKALEKAEESNSTKRMAGDGDPIRSRRSRPTWVMPVAVLCGAGVATLATFAAMGGFSRHTPAAQQPVVVVGPAVPAKAAPGAAALQPLQVAPAQSQPNTPAGALGGAGPQAAPSAAQTAIPAGTLNAASLKPKAAPVTGTKSAPLVTLKPAAPAQAKLVQVPSGKARAATAAAQPSAVQPAPVQAAPAAPVVAAELPAAPSPARPEPKVSGIAWQNNGESSFAVVNGRAVLQGGVVDGFKVLEIRSDAVKFSGSNGTFEVPIGKEDQ